MINCLHDYLCTYSMAPKKKIVQAFRRVTRATKAVVEEPQMGEKDPQPEGLTEELEMAGPRARGFMSDARKQSKRKEKMGPTQEQDPIDDMFDHMAPTEFERMILDMRRRYQKR